MKKTISTLVAVLALFACKNNAKTTSDSTLVAAAQDEVKYPSDVITFMDKFRILLGDGTRTDSLVNFEKKEFFYVANDGERDWVVYKTPNSGVTSRTSSNTRSELGEKKHWIPEDGGKLTGTLKVMHVSTTGDATVSSSYSGIQKVLYSGIMKSIQKGIILEGLIILLQFGVTIFLMLVRVQRNIQKNQKMVGEEFSYEVNVYKGIMYLTFMSEGHKTIKFTKSLIQSEFATKSAIPEQVLKVYANREKGGGVERDTAYAGEMQYFKQGCYNQANGKSTKSDTYHGDIAKQYANGSYAEVWFKEATIGPSTSPSIE